MSKAVATKRQRASQACDFCHARGLRCRGSAYQDDDQTKDDASCLTCTDYGVQCTMDRPVKKRGRRPQAIASVEHETEMRLTQNSHIMSLQTIHKLVRIYRDTMYQCYFPFLNENDLLTRWEHGIPDADEPSYMLLMALCAISSHVAALKAVFDETLLEDLTIPDSEHYFMEAISKIPAQLSQPQDLDYLRSFGLLTVYSLQRGNNGDFHRYLGMYHAIVAEYGFHDESRWSDDLSLSEVDDRRRLFWCVYRLEIHSSCVFGHLVRLPEAQVSVHYPRITPAMDPETQTWTAGWDYITDLFRLLEYAIFGLRACKNRKAILAVFCDRPSPTMLLDSLAQLKASKPRTLIRLHDSDSDAPSNRCKYMAVQISCTETTTTIMALLYCQAPARDVMEIAEDFLQELSSAPLIMFKIASNQIVHQLLGVGHMLSNATRYDNGQYQAEARRLIAFLGDLVKSLESVVPAAGAAGDKLLMLAKVTA